MKKPTLLICLMLSALGLATTGCTKHDNDDDDSSNTTVTSLSGKTWTFWYDSQKTTVDFSNSTATLTEDDGDTELWDYSYNGEQFRFSYHDGNDYDTDEVCSVYCTTKATTSNSLQGTVWKFDQEYGSSVYTYTIYLYEDTYTIFEEDYGEYERGRYSYDGNTITATFEGETISLQCGRILYEMARSSGNIW